MKKLLLNIGILLLCIILSNCGADTSPDKWEQKKLEVQEIQRQSEISKAKSIQAQQRAIDRKTHKVQAAFSALENSAREVSGRRGLQKLKEDLVYSGIIYEEVFDLASEDGVVTYKEMKIVLSTIKGLPDLTPDEITDEEERELEEIRKLFQ